MGVQKTYGYATSKGIAGGIYDMYHYPVDSRTNAAASGKLTFGMGVVPGDTPGSNVTIPTASSKATDFEGVLVNGFDRQQDLEGRLYILNGHAPWPYLGQAGQWRSSGLWRCSAPAG